MKALRSVGRIVFLAATCASLSVAQEPGRHPAYLHALSDLRDARAHLNQLAPSGKMDREEEHAMREIDAPSKKLGGQRSTTAKTFLITCRSTPTCSLPAVITEPWNCSTRRAMMWRAKKMIDLPTDSVIGPSGTLMKRSI